MTEGSKSSSSDLWKFLYRGKSATMVDDRDINSDEGVLADYFR